jgi:hypothetical protein
MPLYVQLRPKDYIEIGAPVNYSLLADFNKSAVVGEEPPGLLQKVTGEEVKYTIDAFSSRHRTDVFGKPRCAR